MMLRPIQNAVVQRSWPDMAALVLLWFGMLLLGGSESRLDDWCCPGFMQAAPGFSLRLLPRRRSLAGGRS
jgi:hypothetical protein